MATARLLVVDDQPSLLKAISGMLKPRYDVLSVSSPRKALELIRSTSPIDLVLSDVQMQEMRGLDLLREIRLLSPSTAGILMSSEEALAEVPTGVQFLRKPFSSDELFATVELVLAQFNKLTADLSRKREYTSVLLERATRLKNKLSDTLGRSVEIRDNSRRIHGLSLDSDNPSNARTIICVSCSAELPANAPFCSQCNQPVGQHIIMRDGSDFAIAVQGWIKLHGLTLARAQELVAILKSIKP